jgi:hypothetical protein
MPKIIITASCIVDTESIDAGATRDELISELKAHDNEPAFDLLCEQASDAGAFDSPNFAIRVEPYDPPTTLPPDVAPS